jgi:hypothetical protein
MERTVRLINVSIFIFCFLRLLIISIASIHDFFTVSVAVIHELFLVTELN